MGRKEKNLYKAVDIKHKEIIDVREIGYYATPPFVARYIGKRIIDINDICVYMIWIFYYYTKRIISKWRDYEKNMCFDYSL